VTVTTPKEIREWGIANGLAKASRGRISAECRAAYHEAHPSSETTYEDGSEDVPLPFEELKPEVEYLPPPPRVAMRKENLAYTIDNGVMIGHDHCGRCENLIAYCACAEGPGKVRWVTEEQTPYLVEA
jgi:hypothetical protein